MEVSGHVTGDGGTEEYPLGADALAGGTRRDSRGGAEEHGASEALGQRPLSEQRLLLVDPCRFGVGSVDVASMIVFQES